MESTPKPRAPRKPKVSQEIKNEQEQMFKNGLTDAILGFNPSNPISSQLSQVDTLFKNNRWYLVSNMRQLLSEIYAEHGLIQTLVDVPVDDAFRGGVDIKSKQLSEEDLQQLQANVDREGDLIVASYANKWNRLYGGAGIIAMTDQDPATPLNVNAIGPDSPLEYRDVDMWELFWSRQNTDDYSAAIDQGDLFDTVEYYDYYGTKLHHTRVMKLKGIKAPSFIRPRVRGWGLSIVETLIRSINQYLKATDLCFEVLDEFKVDYFKMKNLANTLLSTNGANAVRTRVQQTNQLKNYNHAVVMDSEDDFIQKELSFTGLAETMQGIRLQIASDMRMPLTKIFGISAAGFSSGEDDIENYNAMVESQVRQKSKYDVLRMLELRCQKLFGYIPDDLQISFKPLRMLSAEQEENVKTQKFTRLLQAAQSGYIDTLEFKDACNKENLLCIQIDTDKEKIEPEGQSEEDSVEEEPKVKEAPKAPKSKLEAPKAKNSLAEAAGDDGSEDERMDDFDPMEFNSLTPMQQSYYQIQNPGKVDEALWSKAKMAAEKAGADNKYAFTSWWYQKQGGQFHKEK